MCIIAPSAYVKLGWRARIMANQLCHCDEYNHLHSDQFVCICTLRRWVLMRMEFARENKSIRCGVGGGDGGSQACASCAQTRASTAPHHTYGDSGDTQHTHQSGMQNWADRTNGHAAQWRHEPLLVECICEKLSHKK